MSSANPFDTDKATEGSGTREPFIGRVVRSEVDSDDERFNTQYDADWDIVYEIEALDSDYENMFELSLNVRQSLGSKFMVFVGHLENIHGKLAEYEIDGLEDMAEFLEGRVYEFNDVDLTADRDFTFEHKGDGHTVNFKELFGGLENPPDSMLLPVREVTDPEELAELGVESEGSVEEVEF